MQELNWNLFKTKFNGKETKAFESLCYLLFCREFGLGNIGIFRFKNQPGIETEPILVNGSWFGFQSKFFDKAIDRKDIEDSIEVTKKQYPSITKIYVYINLEFSKNNKGEEPKSKTEIEQFAKSKNLDIEWRVPSHIEAQLALAENKNLAEYFFSLETGVLDAVNGLIEHASAVLKPISSHIDFNEAIIKIDTANVLTSLIATLATSPVVIVTGVAGVGKTAVIKDFHTALSSKTPLYLFKATEFNVDHINDLFHKYGDISIAQFVNEHEELDIKYVVIDSAEKLADLQNQDAFQEFLSTLLQHDWRIIFTTRYGYLDDLKFQFVDIYGLNFKPFVIENLKADELEALASQYSFDLPTNSRLFDLLTNPFYLGQYLHALSEKGSRIELTLQGFKNRLWETQIAKSFYRINNIHLKRQRCFINLAKARAESGGFFITNVADCDEDALQALEKDEIIERESPSGRFFISHDIYEEWALERLIESSFQATADFDELFSALGDSLPVRRAFRIWLSEQLLSNHDRVKELIRSSFINENIATHWKDEILISVLLSDHSESFFQMFESELMANQQALLLRVIFLLRIACKEIDESLLKLMGITKRTTSMLSTLFTKPRGTGWESAIRFLYDHRESITDSNAENALSLLEEWTNKTQVGETARFAGLLALSYYEVWIRDEHLRYRRLRTNKEKLIGIISSAAAEIKEELKQIFEGIISKQEVGYQTTHYDLVKRALSSATESYAIARNLPEQVLKLAELVWYDDPKRKHDRYEHHSTMVEVESRFCIRATRTDYFPASAFQTPIFQLLQCAPKPTLAFILAFTSRAADCYAKSNFGNEVEEVDVAMNGDTVMQYVSGRLWHAYRGMHVSTHLLESMHMALERWLLEQAKTVPQSEIEELCKYLISQSRSASITAVIVSVVLSEPLKLFNIAAILFRTKEFFFYDTARYAGDLRSNLFTFGTGLNFRHKIFEEERIKAAKAPHRKMSLEHLALYYQLYAQEGESEEAAKERQRAVWDILDEHYAKLDVTADSEREKTWRLYLARMDRRKMDAEVKRENGQTVVQFTPQIDPELRRFSEDAQQLTAEAMKYSSLFLWSHARFKQENEEQYKQYRQYEDDPHQAVVECKSIREDASKPEQDTWSRSYNASIPAYVCAVLIREFPDKLSEEDKTFCKDVLLQFASTPIGNKNYYGHTVDGTEPAILSLPHLLKYFPDERETIKSLMLLLLIYRSQSEASEFTVRAILNNLWKTSFDDAHSLFLGYLLLKPEYEKLRQKARERYYEESGFGEFSDESVLKEFLEAYSASIETVINNKVSLEHLPDLKPIDLEVLNVALQLLPPGTTEKIHEAFIRAAFEVFAGRIFDDGEDKIDFELKRDILQKIAAIVLNTPPTETVSYIRTFVEDFHATRGTAELFEQFLWKQDLLQAYEQFWLVWNAFYPKVVELSRSGPSRYDAQAIVHNYLFAWNYWNQNAKEWHTLKERGKQFFQRVVNDMGRNPTVLYSVAKVLNEVGSGFFEDGIIWIGDMLQNNPELQNAELEENTTYYLENVVRKYALLKRSVIRSSAQIKSRVVSILNFLIEKGSVVGYLLREDIL